MRRAITSALAVTVRPVNMAKGIPGKRLLTVFVNRRYWKLLSNSNKLAIAYGATKIYGDVYSTVDITITCDTTNIVLAVYPQ